MRGACAAASRVVRATEQTGALEKACSKIKPCSAKPSIAGIEIPASLYIRLKWTELSSDVSHTKFGRSAASELWKESSRPATEDINVIILMFCDHKWGNSENTVLRKGAAPMRIY